MPSRRLETPVRQSRRIAVTLIVLVTAAALSWNLLLLTVEVAIRHDNFFAAPSGTLVHDAAYFWGGARLFWLGRLDAVFDPQQFNAWLATQVAPGSMQEFATWSYPPTMLLVLLPLGLLPLPVAVLVWDLCLSILLALTLRIVAAGPRVLRCAVFFGPAAMYSLRFSQNGALTASMLLGAIWLVDRRPVVAGICAGLLVVKPHLAILLPFAFAAGGYWRSFMAASIVALVTLAVSVGVFGTDAWRGFIDQTTPVMMAQLNHAYGIPPQHAMPTTWVTLQSWGAELPVASTGQLLSTLMAIGVTIWAWRRPGTDPVLRNSLTCAVLLLATPYGYVYDAIPLTVAIAILACDSLRRGLLSLEGAVLAATWLWLAIQAFWCSLGLPSFGAPFLAAVAAIVVRRLLRGDRLVVQAR